MLRKLTLAMVLVVALVTGCGNKVNDPDSVTEGYRMAKVNGTLYYDTGRDSEVEARCGVMDGSLTKSGEADIIPTEDGICNFDGANGWQVGTTEGEIEICIDDNWVVFQAIDDPEADFSKFKYCKYMQGTLPNAEIMDKMLVLTDNRDATYNEVMSYYLSSQIQEDIYYTIYLANE